MTRGRFYRYDESMIDFPQPLPEGCQNFCGTGGREAMGDFAGTIDTTGHVIIRGKLLKGAVVRNTCGVTVHGQLYGTIDTTGPVFIHGDVMKGAEIINTGGGEIYGVFDGAIKTTGNLRVYGSIGPNALIRGGVAISYRKVKRMVNETYNATSTRLVEREFWEPV